MRIIAIVTASLALSPGHAQNRDSAIAITDDFTKCRDITLADQRLACFDRTAAVLVAARESGEIVVIDREGMRDAKRAVFGYSLPQIPLFGRGRTNRGEPEVNEISTTITSARQDRSGMYLLGLADQSRWQTTEARTGLFPAPGKAIRIAAGLLGSYTATIDGGRSVKVKRVQ